MRVFDQSGKVLVDGAMDMQSTYTAPKSKASYRVEFNGDEGYIVTIDGRDVEKRPDAALEEVAAVPLVPVCAHPFDG